MQDIINIVYVTSGIIPALIQYTHCMYIEVLDLTPKQNV